MNKGDNDALVDRIRGEYLEMPGMTLRFEQVARLCGIERSACQAVLEALVEAGFLCVTANGAYARVSSDSTRRARADGAMLTAYIAPHVRRRAS
jgi:DNA-binding IclR family transcriptional regulator